MDKIKIENQSATGFGIWLIGWMFTIGYLDLGFWDGALALIIWPYHLGSYFAMFGF